MNKKADEFIGELQENYEDLLSLSENLLEILQKDKPEKELNRIIGEREKVVKQIGSIESIMKKEFKEQDDAAAFKKLKETLKKILDVDANCRELLNKEKAKIADQLLMLRKGSAATKGYRKDSGGGPAKFISIKE